MRSNEGRSPGGRSPGGRSPGGRSPGGTGTAASSHRAKSTSGRSPGGRSQGGRSPGASSHRANSTSGRSSRANLGFLLAKASQRWNERLTAAFAERGFHEVRASYGSVLLPLWEEDGLRMGELAERARLTKQTMTTLVRLCERDGLVARAPDPFDGRATLVSLTERAMRLRRVAATIIGELEDDVRGRIGASAAGDLERALGEVMEL